MYTLDLLLHTNVTGDTVVTPPNNIGSGTMTMPVIVTHTSLATTSEAR